MNELGCTILTQRDEKAFLTLDQQNPKSQHLKEFIKVPNTLDIFFDVPFKTYFDVSLL